MITTMIPFPFVHLNTDQLFNGTPTRCNVIVSKDPKRLVLVQHAGRYLRCKQATRQYINHVTAHVLVHINLQLYYQHITRIQQTHQSGCTGLTMLHQGRWILVLQAATIKPTDKTNPSSSSGLLHPPWTHLITMIP